MKERDTVSEMKGLYKGVRNLIIARLEEFRLNLNDDYKILSELIFCLLTPQSKAKACWRAVERIVERKLLLENNVSKEELIEELRGVRFKNRKAEYILRIKNRFIENGKPKMKEWLTRFDKPWDIREWLVKNIDGLGYKEASHFLRNIGLGKEFAILDRHILKNLNVLGVIEDIPNSMSRKKYLEIEKKMKSFAKDIDIPMDHLDLLLWYKETGEVFK